ncbi:hypothetical protein TorRG33x02_169730 [Trema orientale]|uniref:Transmembrane protein n=1 Tax=Trema orientale TaxID=63057 RepID=A0A2P5ENT2_TREOI|nr:hypothetical protein TorRG33x02_169730 [Trema orientale]
MDLQNFTIFFFFLVLMWGIPDLQWTYFQLQDTPSILRPRQEVVVGRRKALSTAREGNLRLLRRIGRPQSPLPSP